MKELRKYLEEACLESNVKKASILSSNESLKRFGTLWNESQADVMMMLAVLQYEFIQKGEFTEEQITAVNSILGESAKFMRDCGKEWRDYLDEQSRKARA